MLPLQNLKRLMLKKLVVKKLMLNLFQIQDLIKSVCMISVLASAPDILAWTFHHGHLGTQAFRHENTSASVFVHTMDILPWEHYGTGPFWHMGACTKMSLPKCLPRFVYFLPPFLKFIYVL